MDINITLYLDLVAISTNPNVQNKNSKLGLYIASKKCNTEIYFIFIGWVNFEKMSDLNNPTYLFFKNHKNFFVENSLNFFDNSKNLDVVQKNYEKYLIEGDLHPNSFGSNLLFKTLDKFYSQIIK